MPRRGNFQQESAFRSVIRTLKVLGICSCLLIGFAASQETPTEPPSVKYRTEIRDTGDSRLDTALKAVSQLAQLQEGAPTGAIGLLARARADRDRFARALESEGYWAGAARVTVADLPVDAPDLTERLERFGDGAVPVVVSVDKGEVYRIASISVRSVTPEGAAAVAAAADELGLALATRRARKACWPPKAACGTGCWRPGTRWRRSPGGKPW